MGTVGTAQWERPDDRVAPAEPAAPDTRADRRTRWLYLATGAAAVASIVSAGVLAVVHHWVPVGDNAFLAVRTHDVFSTHPPLVGVFTSASTSFGLNFNSPGPLYFDALAFPTAIFGSTNAGVAVGAALVNLVSAIGIGVVARRQGGYVVGAAAFTVVAVLAWSLGSEVLIEPLHPPVSLLLPLLLVMVLTWGVVRDDLVLLPWLVGAASLVLQTYITYAYLIFIMSAWAAACTLLRLHASHYGREQMARVRRYGLIALLVGVLCWIQPVVQQFFGDGPGNLALTWRAARTPATTYGFGTGTRLTADVVSVPPFWFRPSYHDFLAVKTAPESSVPVAVVTLVIVTLLLALIARVAIRSTRDVVGTAAATGLVALGAGVITACRIPVGLFGVPTSHVFRWLWPLSAFITFAFVIALVQYTRHFLKPTVVVAGLTAIAVLFAALNLPTSDQNPNTITDAMPVARDIGEQLAVLKDRGPVVVDLRYPLRFGEMYSAYVLAALQHHGVPFTVNDEITLHQVGFFRRYNGKNALAALLIREGDQVNDAPPGSERVALHLEMSPSDQLEMTSLEHSIAGMLHDGTITLKDGRRATHLAQPPPADPAATPAFVRSPDFATLVLNKGLTIAPAAQPTVDRYLHLHDHWLRRTVAVYRAPLTVLGPAS